MNRRNFLKIFGLATAGATIAYSFPSIIIPKNIGFISEINLITKNEIYPKLIDDFWFQASPFMSYVIKISDDVEYGFGYVEENGIWKHEVRKSEPEVVLENTEPIYFINSKELEIVPKEEKPLLHRIFGISS